MQSTLVVFFAEYKLKLGDNCIQNFYLRRYIVGYTVGNIALERNFEFGYPHSYALLQYVLSQIRVLRTT